MNPYQVGRCYLAMKAHFNKDSYDVFQYNGRIIAPKDTLEARRDWHRMVKMAKDMKDAEIVQFFVANFSRKTDYSGLFDDQSDTRYKAWMAHIQSLTYNFGNEVKSLFTIVEEDGMCYNDVFFSDEGYHPPVLTAYMGKDISIETFLILNRLNRFTDKLVSDVVTEQLLRTARKYDPFLKVDLETYDNITKRVREEVFNH